MSNDPNTSIHRLAIAKDFLRIALTIIIVMYPWSYLSSDLIGDWLNSSLIGWTLIIFGFYVSIFIAEQIVVSPELMRVLCDLRFVIATIAMISAVGATVKFVLHGAPVITWPMQKEWRAFFVASGIIVCCGVILIPPARTWLSTKIRDRS